MFILLLLSVLYYIILSIIDFLLVGAVYILYIIYSYRHAGRFYLGDVQILCIVSYFRFTVCLCLRVPHMTVVSAHLVSSNYVYWLSLWWGILS